jgi:hypothetical protein
VTFYSVLGNPLPAGLSLDSATGTISGTPTAASASAAYFILATGPGGLDMAAITLTVNAAAPAISYPLAPPYVVGKAITPVVPTLSGGPATSYAVSGTPLPAGLMIDPATGEISGTPTAASATANYLILATGPGGTDTASIALTVYAAPVVSYAQPSAFPLGQTISPVMPVSSGGPISGFTVLSSTWPTGLLLDATTGAITGIPAVASPATAYAIVVAGPGGLDTAHITMAVVAAPVFAYPTAAPLAVDSIAVPVIPLSSGGPIASYAVLGAPLPAGLLLDTATGIITGKPVEPSAPTSYAIVARGPGGADTAVVSLVVHAAPVVSYLGPQVYPMGIAIAPLQPQSTGGVVTSYHVLTPLPAGLILNETNGIISGTPTTETAAGTYILLALGPGGMDTAVLILTTPVGVQPGAFVFRVSGADKPYTFRLPAGAAGTEQVTMRISDVWGRTLWTHAIHPSRDAKAREIVWNGRSANGLKASAGMYVVRLAVTDKGQTAHYVRQAVTLKPGR